MSSQKSKSRNLSVYSYFQILQEEWIVADLRRRICPKNNQKDRRYWERVMAGKKSVIESIASKNFLPSIFTDEDMKDSFEKAIYNKVGPPNFIYKTEEDRKIQEPNDLMFYYSRGSDVRVTLLGETKVGKVKLYNSLSKTVIVEVDGDSYEYPQSEVTRIF